ncbi:MAG: tRNA guanosine(34) transglycosylase Tgt [Candidatus Taylorbacteria bacterium CG11_big_fil_rev_8_21_14_0_20_46_11]|uniref:Queuine tRNA-ribosyltransferase n=1 Tax=Candidatus Taylorbacteria bacterium CG11_big_fil_rev_8_21_14_0_20_46_11 TaxID=1975025 RepID=A0A2H0KBL6_9BACT|nr:MAG: tRNA guanosine(34) transglycosylase Tgt [Candidatus Taylorbacteria bacterium CG11_big_fil_rev_8_21_14_0_20_46_11]
MDIPFKIEKRLPNNLGRAGRLTTAHGEIQTPAFVTVGTKATVKALTPDQVKALGAQVVLANTYHLYLEPGEKIVEEAGGLGKFMGWDGPTMTDSGGFQVFSLGVGFGRNVGKVRKSVDLIPPFLLRPSVALCEGGKEARPTEQSFGRVPSIRGGGFQNPSTARKPVFPFEKGELGGSLAKIDDDGVTFKSYKDGSVHRFTPERSIEIQHAIGADIIFAFDECTSPEASKEYQKEAMTRTHLWAERSLARHKALFANSRELANSPGRMLFGITQGGRYEDLRKESANIIGKMDFDGFGIGGSFEKEDMGNAVRWVNERLPEEKPRHLLGIGEPTDLFEAVKNGCDLFDCVAPTRQARNGSLYTKHGRLNIDNSACKTDLTPVETDCTCYTCQHFTRAYLSHLYRSDEILSHTLTSIHNVHFLVSLVDRMRESILTDTFMEYKEDFLKTYKK